MACVARWFSGAAWEGETVAGVIFAGIGWLLAWFAVPG
jgi:hypothetical protein